ncbi:hypothetical protein [uncultured Anaerofustis sp.]|uniref:hypothetical protein n=2 Tax=uncultured Anaerofustis sp. TaxID=904996 RepID=UPI002608DE09|nr:hypothetical protein [uncultured Anaerofustis sp.]
MTKSKIFGFIKLGGENKSMEKDRQFNTDEKSNNDNAVIKKVVSKGVKSIEENTCTQIGKSKDIRACSKCGKTFCKYRNKNIIIILTFLFCLYGFILIISLYFICFFKV